MRALAAALAATLFTTPLAGQSHLLIVGGLGGEPQYVADFHEWGLAMVDAARRFGLAPEQITYLAESPELDRGRIHAASTKENVERALRDIAGRVEPGDRVLILLIGHGSADDRGARINLPGPDMTAAELASLLEPFGHQQVAIVNAASASGGFQDALAGEKRVVITATRTGAERNETIFGRFFVEAFSNEGADADKNARVSLLEAFEYAAREVERFYQVANRLQLEHGRMEGDAELARAFHLVGLPAAVAEDAPEELRPLLERRAELEQSIELLRLRQGQMEPAAYEHELERLLLDLARTNREIRERGGGGR